MTEEPRDWSDKASTRKEAAESILSKIRWGLVAFIAISVVLIVLSAQNTQIVRIKAFWWEADSRLQPLSHGSS